MILSLVNILYGGVLQPMNAFAITKAMFAGGSTLMIY